MPATKSLFSFSNDMLKNLTWYTNYIQQTEPCRQIHGIDNKYGIADESPEITEILSYFQTKDHIASYVLNQRSEILYPVWLNTECQDAATLQYMTLKNRTNYRLIEKGHSLCGKSESHYANHIFQLVQKKWEHVLLSGNEILFPDNKTRIRIALLKDNEKRDQGWSFCKATVTKDQKSFDIFFSKYLELSHKKFGRIGRDLGT